MEAVDAAVRDVQLVGARAAGADGRGDGRAARRAVQRVLGPWPGLLAGLLFALTPVATLLFRYDNPDALMTLLVVAAAYATTRAIEDGRTRWVVLTGGLLGLAFLTKSLQAFLVLPALAGVLLVAAPGVAAPAPDPAAGRWRRDGRRRRLVVPRRQPGAARGPALGGRHRE